MAGTETILLALQQLSDWGIVSTDAALRVVSWNAWLEKSSGLTAERVIGQNLLDLFPELAKRQLERFFREALDGKIVLLSQRLHGYLLPMPPSVEGTGFANMQQSARLAPLIEKGDVIGVLILIEDVTDRVNNDRDLANQANQQRALADLGQRALGSKDLNALMDATANIVAATLKADASAVLELTTSGTEMQLKAGVGWRAGVVGHATVGAKTNSHAGYTLAVTKPVIINDIDSETRFSSLPILKEHELVSGVSVPVVGTNRALGVVSVYTKRHRSFTDENIDFLQAAANTLGLAIERRALEAELQTRLEQLADADKRKDEFLAMLAHELRNPLAPLSSALHTVRMLDPNPAPEITDARNLMERQIEHLVRLVDDLLDVSRITRGRIDLRKEYIELAIVIARAVESSRPLIDAKKHTLLVSIPDASIPIDADPLRVAQVFWNLLNNAAKYTPEGGTIKVIVEREKPDRLGCECAVVRIRDSGMGIPPSMLGKVFDVFTQMERTLDRSEGGLGLGLTLVRRLVEMHGGTVEAASDGAGMGSEFSVRMPIAKRELPSRVSASSEADSPSSMVMKGRRILVVDDNRDAAESLAVLLRLFGNDVRTTHDGRLAIDMAPAYEPEIILLDIGLPGMNGLEVCRTLRRDERNKQTVIVAMTGYGGENDRVQSERAGFDAHLVKPVEMQLLYDLLAKTDLFDRDRKASHRLHSD